MQTIGYQRRSNFGIECVQCDNELIAPERSEYRHERQILHHWHCWKCDRRFEVIWPADTKSIKDVMRRIKEVTTRSTLSLCRWSHREDRGAAREPLPNSIQAALLPFLGGL